MPGPTTLYDKIWNDHVLDTYDDGTCLLLIDRQLLYAGVSDKAFQGLHATGRPVRRPDASLAVEDHMIPTRPDDRRNLPQRARDFVDRLAANCATNAIPYISVEDERQGIVHVTGPEQGLTLPGTLTVCADSHTSTHGALGALAFGIGTSEQEHVLATQTLTQRKARNMRIRADGKLPEGIVAKDLALAILGRFGADIGVGSAVEFAGEAVRNLSMEGRLTLCNMGVEAGGRASLVAPDETTFNWLKGRPFAPDGELWEQAVAYWRTLSSDADAVFDRELQLDISRLAPQVTWGTSPDEVVSIDGMVPNPSDAPDAAKAAGWRRSQDYMDLKPGTALRDIRIQRVFIGSCTNSRIEDLRAAAAVLVNRRVADGVHAMVVPGSGLVRAQAEREGLADIFIAAGCEWRMPGCSMCFAGFYDSVASGQRCASTSNRNFENRQGNGARTHLLSPAMAAAAAVTGRLTDFRELI
jgi:3-isopropylmalate/(R)-2-methylmalate dehydratase large subunit